MMSLQKWPKNPKSIWETIELAPCLSCLSSPTSPMCPWHIGMPRYAECVAVRQIVQKIALRLVADGQPYAITLWLRQT